MDDVVIPDLESFNLDAEKDLETKEIESEQQVIEKGLKVESANPQFRYIREHFEELVDMYKDVRSLVDLKLPADQFMIEVRTKAAIADELTRFIQMIDQVNKVDEDAGK